MAENKTKKKNTKKVKSEEVNINEVVEETVKVVANENFEDAEVKETETTSTIVEETVENETITEETTKSEEPIDETVDNVEETVVENKEKPKKRMSYKDMFGYEWLGQNYDI